MLPKGSPVNLVVAQAPQNVSVPSVTGQNEPTASNALGAAGLKVKAKTQQVGDQAEDGIVLAQNPPAGTQVKRGATVTITVGHFVQQTTTTPQTTPTTTTTTTTTPTTGTTTGTPPPAAASHP